MPSEKRLRNEHRRRTPLFYTICHKKARNFADRVICPQNSCRTWLVRKLRDFINGHRDSAVNEISALPYDAERCGRIRHFYGHTQRNGSRIGRGMEGVLNHCPRDYRAVLLQLENHVEREIHARSRRKIPMECDRINSGIKHAEIAVPGRMRDPRSRRRVIPVPDDAPF